MRQPISRALLSVYDKSNLLDLAASLADHGVELISTGATAAALAEAGYEVTPVSDVTGFPECFDGRVKTLHPKIHGGILADRSKDDHVAALEQLEIAPIDLVVVNLYPFEATVASGADFPSCIEQIDIGGPAMVRAAAKNHGSVAILTSPAQYGMAITALAGGGFTAEERRGLAAAAFAHTAAYDAAVASWFSGQVGGGTFAGLAASNLAPLRYGENPHQAGWLGSRGTGLAGATQLSGKEMSYNNYQDVDAALRAAYDHSDPAVAIIKHANPCGIATASDVATAHKLAHACDPVSAFGGVIAVNRPVSADLARSIAPIFTEVVAAPDFEEEALEILSAKKNLRLLKVDYVPELVDIKQISGGLLAQERDVLDVDPSSWTLACGEPADEQTLADLAFAWRAVRSVKSNAILIAKNGASVGIGMGQVNRVDSARLAVERANTLGVVVESDAEVGGAENPGGSAPERARGAVAASDAFFPFPDGMLTLANAGVTAIVQPGGSIRDDEVIAAAKDAGVTMYVTGERHFAH